MWPLGRSPAAFEAKKGEKKRDISRNRGNFHRNSENMMRFVNTLIS